MIQVFTSKKQFLIQGAHNKYLCPGKVKVLNPPSRQHVQSDAQNWQRY